MNRKLLPRLGSVGAALFIALVFVLALTLSSPAAAACRCGLKAQPLDVVFVFDSTGSMAGPINAVKREIRRIVRSLTKRVPGLRIGMVTYRDYKDSYQRKGVKLTGDYKKIYRWLSTVRVGGGGNFPEAVELGLAMAIENFKWSPHSRKVIILIGDAPPHQHKISTCVRLVERARARGTVVHTITTGGGGVLSSFRRIARAGGGEAVTLSDNRLARQLLTFSLGYSPVEDTPRSPLRKSAPALQGSDSTSGRLVLARLVHEGKHDVPHNDTKLLKALREHEGLDFRGRPAAVRLNDARLFEYPLLYVTGHQPLGLSAEDKGRLKTYLERGGFVFAEACCGRQAFDQDFRKLMAELFPDHKLKALPRDHPLYQQPRKIDSLRLSWPPATGTLIRMPPRLEGLTLSGRLAVVYSRDDLGCAWTSGPGVTCGVAEGAAYALTLNILMHGLTR